MKSIIVTGCFFSILFLIILTIVRLFQVYQDIIPMKTGVMEMVIYIAIMFICLGVIILLLKDDNNDLGGIT